MRRHTQLLEVKLSSTQWEQWTITDSTDLITQGYHIWGAMLEKYHQLQLKPKTIDGLKVALQTFGKSCHKNTSTRWWWTAPSVWLHAWLPQEHFMPVVVTSSICGNSVHHQVCIFSLPTNQLFLQPLTHCQGRQCWEHWEMLVILSFSDILSLILKAKANLLQCSTFMLLCEKV